MGGQAGGPTEKEQKQSQSQPSPAQPRPRPRPRLRPGCHRSLPRSPGPVPSQPVAVPAALDLEAAIDPAVSALQRQKKGLGIKTQTERSWCTKSGEGQDNLYSVSL